MFQPFACTYCDKAFSEHWALIKHCRTHTKEKVRLVFVFEFLSLNEIEIV